MLGDILYEQMVGETVLESMLDNDIELTTETAIKEEYSPDDCDDDGIFPDDDEDDENVDYEEDYFDDEE